MNRSLWLANSPCGAPSYSRSRACGSDVDNTRAVASIGTVLSAVPWMISVGTVIDDRSDVKSVVLLQEVFRQLKPLAAWGDGEQVLVGDGVDTDAPGVLSGVGAVQLVPPLLAALGAHRAWAREALVTASAVPPVQ